MSRGWYTSLVWTAQHVKSFHTYSGFKQSDGDINFAMEKTFYSFLLLLLYLLHLLNHSNSLNSYFLCISLNMLNFGLSYLLSSTERPQHAVYTSTYDGASEDHSASPHHTISGFCVCWTVWLPHLGQYPITFLLPLKWTTWVLSFLFNIAQPYYFWQFKWLERV